MLEFLNSAGPRPDEIARSSGLTGDAEAARRVATMILEAAGATGIGFTPVSPAEHQIGTHRMGTDPPVSVVDPNLRAHDVDNLYLVGSGCFVTASTAPPTLTIAALALRAAEHIKARLRAG